MLLWDIASVSLMSPRGFILSASEMDDQARRISPMKIFISYRRDDSAGYAGRLFDHLSAHFGADNVFMDIDTIQPGEDFRKVISRAVGTCDVVIVMMGRQWLNITDAQDRRRLADPRDWVRMELTAALANRRIRVIPVLIRDAHVPGEHELPEGLKELAWRNAMELSDSRFQHDVMKLIGVIERIAVKVADGVTAPVPTVATVPPPRANNTRNALLLAGLSLITLLVVLLWILVSSYLKNTAAATSALVISPPTATALIVTSTNTAKPTITHQPSITPQTTNTLSLTPTSTSTLSIQPTGAKYSPIITEIQTQRSSDSTGVIIYAYISFQDKDGDSYLVTYEVVNSTARGITVNDDSITASMQEQSVEATVRAKWQCLGKGYVVTLNAKILDRSGHQSNLYPLVFDCR
jgi:hypothetical protein